MRTHWIPLTIALAFCTMAAPVSVFDICAESENQDVILSSDFENNDMSSWMPFGGGGVLSIAYNTSHSGESCLKITDRTQTYQGPSANCSTLFEAGETYTFDAWIYHDSDSTKNFAWTLRYIDSTGLTHYEQIAATEQEPGEWIQMLSTITLPEDSSDFFIYFESSNASVNFYIDDISIMGKAPEADNEDESDSDTNSDYTYYFDFENGSAPWTTRGDERLLHNDEYSNTGTHSIYSSNRDNTWNGPSVNISEKVKPNTKYFFSAYVMYNGAEYEASHIFRIELQYTLDGKENYMLISDKEIEKYKWERISGYYTIPENAENVQFYIQTNNVDEEQEPQLNDLMSFYVDTVTIAEATVVKRKQNIMLAVIAVSALILLIIAAFIIRFIIKRVKKNKEAIRLAANDAMTHVLNRNSYEKRISELTSNPEEVKLLYFTLCDVNFLKFINDNYGHKKGDEAIIRCAEALLKIVGTDGSVYRTGGDEFVCITKKPIQDKIKKSLEIEVNEDKGYPFSIAVGFSCYDSDKDGVSPDVKSIIKRSDIEMYADKQRIKTNNPDFSRK